MGRPQKKSRQDKVDHHTFTDIFLSCQQGLQGINKHLKTMRVMYSKMSIDEFFEGFIHCLKYAMVVYKREPAVERIIEFATRFALSLSRQAEEPGAEPAAAPDGLLENPLLDRLFKFILQVHGAQEKAVRFRCCQLVSKLLGAMGDDAQIDDHLYDCIYESMLTRMRDKSYAVRMQAVQALTRLQDPTNKDCPIVNAYLFLMTCDPNPEVRRTVLSGIAVSRKTLPAILERTHDTKDTVRRAAFTVLTDKVGVKALSIAQRVQLLQSGLADRSECVRKECEGRLLQSWLRSFGGSIPDLLRALDVENSSDTCKLALAALFDKAAPGDIIAAFDHLNARQVVDQSRLTCESAFYWRSLCSHFHKLGAAGEVHLEKLLPTASVFAAYIRAVVDDLVATADSTLDQQLSSDFMLQQLIGILAMLDYTDEAGRKEVLKLVHYALKSERTSIALLKPLMESLGTIVGNPEHRGRDVCEIIAEISEPTEVVEEMIGKEEMRQLELKLAGVRVAQMQASDELEQLVQQQLFEEAAKVKAKMGKLDAEKSAVMQQMQPRLKEQHRDMSDSAATLLRCITILGEFLLAPDVEQLSSAVRMSVDTLILPGVQNEDPAVRNAAVHALSLVCILDANMARSQLLLFMQVAQIDQEAVKVTALSAMFDLILAFGVEIALLVPVTPADEAVGDGDDQDDAPSSMADEINGNTRLSTASEPDEPASPVASCSVINILTALLDSEVSAVRTAVSEGMAKLLLSGRLLSPKLLSRLLLLWYNPLTEDDASLRHCLGTFFPMFAFASRTNQELFERAFLPTLQTLFDAPNSSPLASIDGSNVADLLVQLTSARHLVSGVASSDSQRANIDCESSPVHDSLALKLCNKILQAPQSFGVRVLTRVLTLLELTASDVVLIKDLDVLIDEMLRVVKEKQSIKYLLKVQETVKGMKESHRKANAENMPPTNVNEAAAGELTTVDGEGPKDENQDPVASFLTQPALAKRRSNERQQSGQRSDEEQQHRTGRKLANTTADASSWLLPDSSFATPLPPLTSQAKTVKKALTQRKLTREARNGEATPATRKSMSELERPRPKTGKTSTSEEKTLLSSTAARPVSQRSSGNATPASVEPGSTPKRRSTSELPTTRPKAQRVKDSSKASTQHTESSMPLADGAGAGSTIPDTALPLLRGTPSTRGNSKLSNVMSRVSPAAGIEKVSLAQPAFSRALGTSSANGASVAMQQSAGSPKRRSTSTLKTFLPKSPRAKESDTIPRHIASSQSSVDSLSPGRTSPASSQRRRQPAARVTSEWASPGPLPRSKASEKSSLLADSGTRQNVTPSISSASGALASRATRSAKKVPAVTNSLQS